MILIPASHAKPITVQSITKQRNILIICSRRLTFNASTPQPGGLSSPTRDCTSAVATARAQPR